ncbi:MAG: MFS transporter [Alphaproteobacteria bacterium]|nr:MFS transporter [Alphaproteobacteria bacterium]
MKLKPMLNHLKKIKDIYFNKRMIIMLLLGFSSGFPLPLVFGTLSFLLKDYGIAYASIGAISLVKIPYSLKWLWSPVVDNVKIPWLYKIGRRRSWALITQILLGISIFLMSTVNPQQHLYQMAVFAFITSFLSATQDIILDAYRVESFNKEPEKLSSGVAVFVLGYRFGLIFSGAGAIYLASKISWSAVYVIMSLGILIGLAAIIFSKEAIEYKYQIINFDVKNIKKFFNNSLIEPFKNFIKNESWFWILAFIFTYRLSDSYFGPMSNPFYDDLGFTKEEIAFVTKIYSIIMTIIGGLLGGILVLKLGMRKSLLLFGFTQCITTSLFSLQAYYGHNMPLFMVIVALEYLSSGLATTAFVAYISSLCNKLYTATQYALLSSVMSLSRDLFSATSGVVYQYAENLYPNCGWIIFFIISGLMSLPSIFIVLFCIKKYK